MEEQHVYRHHNKTLLLYHMVFPAKYRRDIFTREVEKSLKEVCLGIGERYEMHFVEIGMEENHVHFLAQGVPKMSVERMVTIIKSITGREIFKKHPEVKRKLWGGHLWTSGYYANTVGQYASADVIKQYVAGQGRNPSSYKKLYGSQLRFDF